MSQALLIFPTVSLVLCSLEPLAHFLKGLQYASIELNAGEELMSKCRQDFSPFIEYSGGGMNQICLEILVKLYWNYDHPERSPGHFNNSRTKSEVWGHTFLKKRTFMGIQRPGEQ